MDDVSARKQNPATCCHVFILQDKYLDFNVCSFNLTVKFSQVTSESGYNGDVKTPNFRDCSFNFKHEIATLRKASSNEH